MATKSAVTAVANVDSGARNEALLTKGRAAVIPFTYEKVVGNTDGDQIQIARVHSSWSVESIKVGWDAMAGLTDVNIGLWSDEAPADADDVDENCYADAIDPHSGAAMTEYAFTTRDIAKAGQKVWQDAGLSAEPEGGRWYRIALNLSTGGVATGTIAGFVRVILPS